MDKFRALKTSNGQFDKSMHLSDEAKTDLKWWVHSIDSSYNLVNHGEPTMNMTTDASKIE